MVDAKNAGGTSANSAQVSATPSAALIAYNGFNGSPTGWTSFTYSPNHSITAAALTYTGLPVVGNAIAATSKITAGDNSAGILPSVQQTGVVYISYLVNLGAIVTADSPSAFLWFYNGATELWRVGSVPWASPAYAFGFFDAASNTQAWSSTVPASNTTYLLVAKADFTNGNLKMYINPTIPGSEPGAANATLAVTAGQMAFDRIKVALENNTSARIDEVRVGPSWASVTP